MPAGGIEAQFGEGITGGDVWGWFRSLFDHIDEDQWHQIVRPPDDKVGTLAELVALRCWAIGAPTSTARPFPPPPSRGSAVTNCSCILAISTILARRPRRCTVSSTHGARLDVRYSRQKASTIAITRQHLLLLAFLLASPAVTRATQAAEGTATVPRYEPSPCPKLKGIEWLADASCGYLVVPENRSRPAGRNIRLMVAKYPARSAEKRRDPVIYLAGGPGDIAPLEVNGFIAANFIHDRDIVVMSQRGTMFSEPALIARLSTTSLETPWPPLLLRGDKARAFGRDRGLPPRTRRRRRTSAPTIRPRAPPISPTSARCSAMTRGMSTGIPMAPTLRRR